MVNVTSAAQPLKFAQLPELKKIQDKMVSKVALFTPVP